MRRAFSKFFKQLSDSSDGEVIEGLGREVLFANKLTKEKVFRDKIVAHVRAGKGGDGCHSLIRRRFDRRAFPSGGTGGNGGSVFVEAHSGCQTLTIPSLVKAKDGDSGKGSDMNGKAGKDTTLRVPLGTIITENNEILADLDTQGSILVAAGGKGGRGNKDCPHFESAEKGQNGEHKKLLFELKLLADIGFVGFPNAGKTSLLASLTRACPKIASYPFTTLRPYVGILEFNDGLRLSIADMPGLIEGAHVNKGLGHQFLKHIMRTKGLLYVLDATDSPLERLTALFDELGLYDKELLRKPYNIVLNKSDIIQDRTEIDALKQSLGRDILEISARHAFNLSPLVASLRELVERTRLYAQVSV
mmetsp:Transcript_32572/g.56390  ORF Transcript_32572/g.56390 Transcript_32572/m.56390 type:complete len:361 (-) Transcript_32572:746-1828(-)